MEHDNCNYKMEELHMETRVPIRLQKMAEKMEKLGRTEYKTLRRPRWKEYSLVKYDEKQE